jgi:hypothetical protein
VALFLIGAALAVANGALAGSVGADGQTPTANDDAGPARDRDRAFAEIQYVDVGQGDAVVMRVGDAFVVNDAGQFNVEGVDPRCGHENQLDLALFCTRAAPA